MVCVRQLSNASPFTTTRHTELLFSEVTSHGSGRDYRQRRKEAPLETLPQGTGETCLRKPLEFFHNSKAEGLTSRETLDSSAMCACETKGHRSKH